MPSHHEAIARRMVARLAPGDGADEAPSSPTDETTDESAAPEGDLSGDLVLVFADVVTRVAGLAWATYEALEPGTRARRQRAAREGDMPVLQRESARLKEILVGRLQAEVVTPAELPERGRARILDAAAEETLAEADRAAG
jgi:hypothetical protein